MEETAFYACGPNGSVLAGKLLPRRQLPCLSTVRVEFGVCNSDDHYLCEKKLFMHYRLFLPSQQLQPLWKRQVLPSTVLLLNEDRTKYVFFNCVDIKGLTCNKDGTERVEFVVCNLDGHYLCAKKLFKHYRLYLPSQQLQLLLRRQVLPSTVLLILPLSRWLNRVLDIQNNFDNSSK